MVVNYQNGKIYKIEPINGEEGDVYVGSTTNEHLSTRFGQHKSEYNKWKAGRGAKTTSFILFEKYGIDACKIILIEASSCNTKDELTSKEAEFIITLKCVNKCVPHRTLKQYREDNKKHIAATTKLYREANQKNIILYRLINKDTISIKDKENRFECECGSELRYAEKSRHYKTAKHIAFMDTNQIV